MKRTTAQRLVTKHHYNVRRVCEFLGLSPSSYYYQAKTVVTDEELVAAVQEIAGRYPTYGTRRGSPIN